MSLEIQKERLFLWFSQLQRDLIKALEDLEAEYCATKEYPYTGFTYHSWTRDHSSDSKQPNISPQEGGGGNSALLTGKLFEKAGVNVSQVSGSFSPDFASHIPGTESDPSFWASGISVVIHPTSPLLPTVHMNTRCMITQKQWFGGGADLTPFYPQEEDTLDFHAIFKEVCDRYNPLYYPHFKQEADNYFYLPHRQEPRGVGGIFYDNINSGNFENDFAFTRDVGTAFASIYPVLIRRHMYKEWTESQRHYQLQRRGRYVEFNLLYDRGTLFGLKTGGNTEAILMSLPPLVSWG